MIPSTSLRLLLYHCSPHLDRCECEHVRFAYRGCCLLGGSYNAFAAEKQQTLNEDVFHNARKEFQQVELLNVFLPSEAIVVISLGNFDLE